MGWTAAHAMPCHFMPCHFMPCNAFFIGRLHPGGSFAGIASRGASRMASRAMRGKLHPAVVLSTHGRAQKQLQPREPKPQRATSIYQAVGGDQTMVRQGNGHMRIKNRLTFNLSKFSISRLIRQVDAPLPVGLVESPKQVLERAERVQ